MDKLGNNFKPLLWTVMLLCILQAGCNASIVWNAGFQAGDLSGVVSCWFTVYTERKACEISRKPAVRWKGFWERCWWIPGVFNCEILTEDLWLNHGSLACVLWKVHPPFPPRITGGESGGWGSTTFQSWWGSDLFFSSHNYLFLVC